MANAIELPWKPPTVLAPVGVPLRLVRPELLAQSVADYLVPPIFALQGSEDLVLGGLAQDLAVYRIRLLTVTSR